MPSQAAFQDGRRAAPQRRSPLSQRSGLLSELFGTIEECFFTLDRNGIFIEANRMAALWFQTTPVRMLGQHYRDILPQDAIYFAMCAAISNGEASITEHRSSLWPDRWVEARFYPSDSGISVFFRDITERKREAFEAVRLRALLQATSDAISAQILIVDGSGTIISANES